MGFNCMVRPHKLPYLVSLSIDFCKLYAHWGQLIFIMIVNVTNNICMNISELFTLSEEQKSHIIYYMY